MDQLAAMRAFLAVADAHGFAPAARRLGVAASSLTRQVDTLEKHLNTQLFYRSTRSVTLTPLGEVYRENAIHALDALREADHSVAEADGPPSGLLRVSVPASFGRIVIGPTLSAFTAAYPEIVLEISATDDVESLVDRRLDVAIRLGRPGEGTLIARRLAPHRRVVCASPTLLKAAGEPETPAALSQLPCLAFTHVSERPFFRFRPREGGEETLVELTGPLRATSSELLREAAIGGSGFIVVPTWLVGRDIREGRLTRVLEDWSIGGDDGAIHAVTLPNRRGSRRVRAFVEHLITVIGQPPVWEDGLGLS